MLRPHATQLSSVLLRIAPLLLLGFIIVAGTAAAAVCKWGSGFSYPPTPAPDCGEVTNPGVNLQDCPCELIISGTVTTTAACDAFLVTEIWNGSTQEYIDATFQADGAFTSASAVDCNRRLIKKMVCICPGGPANTMFGSEGVCNVACP